MAAASDQRKHQFSQRLKSLETAYDNRELSDRALDNQLNSFYQEVLRYDDWDSSWRPVTTGGWYSKQEIIDDIGELRGKLVIGDPRSIREAVERRVTGAALRTAVGATSRVASGQESAASAFSPTSMAVDMTAETAVTGGSEYTAKTRQAVGQAIDTAADVALCAASPVWCWWRKSSTTGKVLVIGGLGTVLVGTVLVLVYPYAQIASKVL